MGLGTLTPPTGAHVDGVRARSNGKTDRLRLTPMGRRRSWPWLLAGLLLVLVCAVGFAATAARLGGNRLVLAVSRDVAAGQPLTGADLTQVRISSGGPLAVVPAAELSSVLGRPAAVPLTAGSLLTSAELGPLAAVAGGQALIGVDLKPGGLPPGLTAGQTVQLFDTAAGGGFAGSDGVGTAVVNAISPAGDSSGDYVVGLQLAQPLAGPVLRLAAAGQLALAVVGGSGG